MKLEKFDPKKTWFIADPHLGHANIIKFCDRPFRNRDGTPDVVRMDRAIIENWNSEVEHDHDVFIVGDFAYKCDSRTLNGYFHALHGRKHLVPGNHDGEMTLQLPWDSRPEMIRQIMVGSQHVVMSHYAMRTWPGVGKGTLHFYGHSHGGLPPVGNSIDVGVDVFKMRPVRLEDIVRRLKAWPKNEVRPVEKDHHMPDAETA